METFQNNPFQYVVTVACTFFSKFRRIFYLLYIKRAFSSITNINKFQISIWLWGVTDGSPEAHYIVTMRMSHGQ